MWNDLSGDQYAKIARALNDESDVESTLESATATALDIVDGCDHAGISLITGRRKISTLASTDNIVVQADVLQYETGEGPCLQSMFEDEVVLANDLGEEKRWPAWTPRVTEELNIQSVLGLQLFIGTDTMGALNLYADSTHAFDPADRISALALAAHISVALTAAKELDGMVSALVHRTVIGQAQGMMMQALKITPDRAFAALVRASQTRNVKLHVIATDIVANGIRSDLFS